MWNYVIPLLTALLALLQLLKDWRAHEKWWRRVLALALILLLGFAGWFNARKSKEQGTTIQSLTTTIGSLKTTISSLDTAVETANANQVQNTKVFTESLERLSGKLSDLETGVKTADLREEADRLRAELTKTQKALITPLAELNVGFIESYTTHELQQYKHLVVTNGEPVTFEIQLENESDVPAHNVILGVRVCIECKFHSEPIGAEHPKGQAEYERTFSYERVLPHSDMPVIQIVADVPDYATGLQLGSSWTCENCKENGWKIANLGITRLKPKPDLSKIPKQNP